MGRGLSPEYPPAFYNLAKLYMAWGGAGVDETREDWSRDSIYVLVEEALIGVETWGLSRCGCWGEVPILLSVNPHVGFVRKPDVFIGSSV